MNLENLIVVLVRPQFPGNIGSTARAMKNFGLSRLTLVQAQCDYLDPEAKKLSCKGEDILHECLQVNSIREAIKECTLVVATSSFSEGKIRNPVSRTIKDAAFPIAKHCQKNPGAIIYGPESCGLTTEEISLCNYLITIPTSEKYPALNLAQSVAISLYEIFQAAPNMESTTQPVGTASFQLQDIAFNHLQKVLIEVHFLFGEKGDELMKGIRNLIRRANPTPSEIKWLHGFARQLEWLAKKNRIDD